MQLGFFLIGCLFKNVVYIYVISNVNFSYVELSGILRKASKSLMIFIEMYGTRIQYYN